jgi:hypothetical protein
MYRTIQLLLVALVAVVCGLSALSRRFPQIPWLQVFRYRAPRLTEEQRAKMRQRANRYAGIELILLGIVVPMIYFASTVMMFNEPTALGAAIALGSAAILIAIGITAIWRNRSRRSPDRDLR